jgi:sporulation protein YabP
MSKNEVLTDTKHSITLDDRYKMTLSGVKEVSTFSDASVSLKTTRGALLVQGKGLTISRLNTETGELYINGEISLIKYSKDKSKGGIIEGLFR